MGGRCRLGGREMTWFWGASSSPQGVPAERGPNPANPLSAHTQKHTHKDVFSHMHVRTVYSGMHA